MHIKLRWICYLNIIISSLIMSRETVLIGRMFRMFESVILKAVILYK